jgi:hypothetical protein
MNSLLRAAFVLLQGLLFLQGWRAAAQEIDLAALARNRAEWPRELTLKAPLVFPVFLNGEQAGEVELQAGEKVRLLEILGATVRIQHGNHIREIPARHTDLAEQVLAARKAREEAAERYRQQVQAEHQAFEQERAQKVILDGKLLDRSSLKIEKLTGVILEKNADGTVIRLRTGARRITLLGYNASEDVGKAIEVEAVPKDPAAQRPAEYRVVVAPTFDQWKMARSRQ